MKNQLVESEVTPPTGSSGAYAVLVARRDTIPIGVLVLVLVAGLGLLLWPSTERAEYRVADAVVLVPAACGGPDPRDAVRVNLADGRVVDALLDGCGHRPGEELIVEVPAPLPPHDVVVRLAGTGVPSEQAVAQRLSAVGAAVAGMAGALLAWRIRPGLMTGARPVLTGRRV